MSTSKLPILRRLVAIAVVVLFLSGCSSERTKRDWVKSVNGRGLANVWGVIFRVEKIEGEASISDSGTFGETPEGTEATNEIVFGDVVIKLETTKNEKFSLFVDGKRFGTVAKGNQVLVDAERNVFVNKKPREPLK